MVGVALFGALTYLPLFLQVVNGASPTGSGLQLLPVMAGLSISSIGSGQLITRTGRYKPFPIAGTAIIVLGFYLPSTMDAGTSTLAASVFMFVLGLGLGLVMQVLVLAVQVGYEDLGVATSSATLFHSIGGSVGTAALGAVFTNQLSDHLSADLPAGSGAAGRLSAGALDPAAIAKLPAAVHDAFIQAFTDSLSTIFVVAGVIAAIAFALSLLLKQLPLGETVATAGVREAFATPTDGKSLTELDCELSRLSRREGAQRIIERAAARAGIDLGAGAVWLLARLGRDAETDPHALAREYDIGPTRLDAILADLEQRGLVLGHDGAHPLTAAGEQMLARLTRTSQQRLEELVADWHPERYPELAALILGLAREFLLDATPLRGPATAAAPA